MKQPTFLFTALFALFLFPACGPKVYEAPQAASLTNRHEIVALLPPTVTIKGRPKDDPAMLRKAEETERFAFQQEILSWMLRRKQQGRIRVKALDVETTNAKLEAGGYFDGTVKTPAEWAEVLDVDAVFTSRFDLTKPMSEGAVLAIGLLLNTWGTTNETYVNISLHDRGTAELIWNYDWVARGTTFSTPDALINGLMRNASKRMPYTVR